MSTDAPPPSTVVRRLRWGPVCGLVSLLYVVGVAVDRMVLAADGEAYNDLHERLGGPVVRSLLAAVLVAALFHALDGLRRLVLPDDDVRQARARAAVAFLTGALGVPLAVAVLWPWLAGVLP